jgi:myo-inositol-1(or 4)-monophosphatase
MTQILNQSTELMCAWQAAEAAGRILMDYRQKGVTIRSKATADLVSEADVDAERAIVRHIRAHFPEHAILAEEGSPTQGAAEHLWVIDPLDGTTNYLHGMPHFAVSIAYYRHGVPEAAVVWNPARQDQFLSLKGAGAWHNGQRAAVTPSTSLSEVLVGLGFYYDRGRSMEATLSTIREVFGQHVHGIRRFGTASLDLCHVGVGYYGAFFEYLLAPWDYGAGRLVVEEAGGTVTNARGEQLQLRHDSVLASNTYLHQAMLQLTLAHHP